MPQTEVVAIQLLSSRRASGALAGPERGDDGCGASSNDAGAWHARGMRHLHRRSLYMRGASIIPATSPSSARSAEALERRCAKLPVECAPRQTERTPIRRPRRLRARPSAYRSRPRRLSS